MIVRQWPFWFKQLYGGSWPQDYVTWDCETTGFDKNRDVIVEIGHCLVEDGKVKDRLSVVLNWTEREVPPDGWLRKRLVNVRESMARDGKTYRMTYERMRKEGIEPEKALKFYHELFQTLIAQGVPFVGHNGFFDEEMFAHNLAGFAVADDFKLPDNLVFDTMAIEKGNQMVGDKNALPREGETLRSYFRRVKYLRNDVKTNLDTHCVAKYGFAGRHGLDLAKAHTADFDAYLVHLLMEEFRAEADKAPAPGVAEAVAAELPSLFRKKGSPAPVRKPPAGTTALGTTQPQPRYKGQRNR